MTDVIFAVQLTSASARFPHAYKKTVTLLFDITLFFFAVAL